MSMNNIWICFRFVPNAYSWLVFKSFYSKYDSGFRPLRKIWEAVVKKRRVGSHMVVNKYGICLELPYYLWYELSAAKHGIEKNAK